MQVSTFPRPGEKSEYAALIPFARAHQGITYEEFDACLRQEIRLFDLPKNDYFRQIEASLDQVIRTLPAMKRIFARPIVRLRDTQEIVSVEMAHIINSQTFSHAAVHSELWEDIAEDGIKPKKLMTVGRIETYAIYENLVFTNVVDAVFRMLRRTEDLLKDVLHHCRDMHFNLLDRTYHASFFLALGKLYMEYVNAKDFEYEAYFRCIEKIVFIDRTLRAKLGSQVYLQCKKKGGKVPLKRTNIFRVHKDYRAVWLLAKALEGDPEPETSQVGSRGEQEEEAYRLFCIFLSIFSAGHFNFSFSGDQRFDFEHFRAEGVFCGWSLTLETVKPNALEGLVFRFRKEKPYTICVIPGERKAVAPEALEELRGEVKADEYLFANPLEYGDREVLYLNLFNLDSFRRVQQILLRGMIYSDTKREDCPFCGHSLEREQDSYACRSCNAEIKACICKETEEPYFVSGIKKYQRSWERTKKEEERHRFLHDRDLEASLHFRNITPIAPGGKPICPKCQKVHE